MLNIVAENIAGTEDPFISNRNSHRNYYRCNDNGRTVIPLTCKSTMPVRKAFFSVISESEHNQLTPDPLSLYPVTTHYIMQ